MGIDEALKDIRFPVEITSIEQFERKYKIPINVYSYKIINKKLGTFFISH